jgi:dTDP-4-amino-4,6-dideoxygalactose transaminase
MILNANRKIRQASLKDTARIIELYWEALPELKKLGLKELQSVFQEMDENGVPTGYFTRKLNHGKFYRQLDEYKEQLVNTANEKLK